MKLLIYFMCTLWALSDSEYVIINDTLYEMPKNNVTKIITDYNVLAKNIDMIKIDKDSCNVEEVIWIKDDIAAKNEWKVYKVKSDPLFLFEGKFVDMKYFYPIDIKSINLYPVGEAIINFGCKGLNPIFLIELKQGKTIQDKPVGGIVVRSRN